MSSLLSKSHIYKNHITIIKLGAEWCKSCKSEAFLSQFESLKNSVRGVSVLEVDVDSEEYMGSDLYDELKFTKIPNIKIYNYNKMVGDFIGTSSFDEIRKVIDSIPKQQYEEILDPKNMRLSIFPIRYKGVWDLYKTQVSSFWRAEEIDLSYDRNDFDSLSPDEQHVIKMILAFFAQSDGIVNMNIGKNFINNISSIEILTCYQYQQFIEAIHNETYSLVLDNLIKDPDEKEKMFDAINTIPSIKKIGDWAFQYINNEDLPFVNKLVAFACVEGIFFSGAFCTIYWVKKYLSKGRMFLKGLIKSNEFIARDESMHVLFACEVYSLLANKLSYEEFITIVKDAVLVADDFINESIKVKLIGISSEHMRQYIEYVADRLIVLFGYRKYYNTENPFSFMSTIGMMQKTNFFESRPTEYQASTFNGKLILLPESEF